MCVRLYCIILVVVLIIFLFEDSFNELSLPKCYLKVDLASLLQFQHNMMFEVVKKSFSSRLLHVLFSSNILQKFILN